MAVGVPTTGLGGIFYILLSIAIVIHKAFKRIAYFFGKRVTESKEKLGLLRFPTMAFILCVGLISYMNLSGFRFAIPGTQQTPVSISNLWMVGLFAFSLFIFFIVLVQIRSEQIEKPQFWLWRVRMTADNYNRTRNETETANPISEPGKDPNTLAKVSQKSYSSGSNAEAVNSNSTVKDTVVHPECSHFFGYLRSLPKDTVVPYGCYSCRRMIDCFSQKNSLCASTPCADVR